MISYLNPDDPVTAARWNGIFAQAETLLSNALGGLSAVFVGADKQWDRGFFFFDPQNPPSTLHPVAAAFLAGYLNNLGSNQKVMFWRQYSDVPIGVQIAGLSQISNSSKFHVVELALPTWTAWLAAIYPSGFGGASTSGMNQTISGVVYAANNCLDVSLAVIKASVSGTNYAATFSDVTQAEHAQPFKPIDVFINAGLTWSSAWDKYSVVRVHNCATTAQAATFGSVSATIPAGGSQCFRKLATGWILCGAYFHTMQSNDGRFMVSPEATGGAASIFMPGLVANVLSATLGISSSNFGAQLDPTQFWDLSGIYNNPSYTPASAGEKAPPAGGYFPALSDSNLLGDCIIHRGKVLVANRAVPATIHATMMVTLNVAVTLTYTFADGSNTVVNVSNVALFDMTTGLTVPVESTPGNPLTTNWQTNGGLTQIAVLPRSGGPITDGDVLRITFDYIPPDDHAWVDFDSFATLAAKLTAVGLASRPLSQSNPFGGTLNNLEIYSAAGWHLVDLSCPLATFLTGGTYPQAAVIVGASQSSSPNKSLALPWLVFGAVARAANPTTTNLTYKQWVLDQNGNPVLRGTITVTVNNAGSTATMAANAFLPTDSLATVAGWISATSTAGGLLGVGNFQKLSTPFGTVLLWEETWGLDAHFTGLLAWTPPNFNGNVRTIKVILQADGLHVTRAILLNETKYFTSMGSGNEVPFEHGIFPSTGGVSFFIGGSSNSVPTRFMLWNFPRIDRCFQFPRWFYHDPADSPFMPASGWANVGNVQNFYEFAPLGLDTVGTVAAQTKSGISRMGAFSASADIWSPFAYWLAKTSALTYPDGASAATIDTSSGWYAANISNVMANATISDPLPNVLPCQAEHFNALASLVNAQPPMKLALPATGVTTFTLNFAAANIIIVNAGSGYTVGQSLNFNLKVATVNGSGGITGISQNGSVVVNSYDAYATPLRPFALAATGGATCDTSSGDASALTFIPKYAPIGVQTPMTGSPATPLLVSPAFYGWTRIFPRTAFYSWNGATAGGADPVATYLAALGLTVQSTLPDSYGATVLNKYGTFTGGTYSTALGTSTDYCQGFNPAFQTQAQTYRWLTINDARTLYGTLNVPFVLNASFAPMSFHVAESTQDSVTLATTNSILAHWGVPPNPGNPTPDIPLTGRITGGSSTSDLYLNYGGGAGQFNTGFGIVSVHTHPASGTYTGYVPANVVDVLSGGGDTVTNYQDIPASPIVGTSSIGAFSIRACEFVNDAAGNWLADVPSAQLCGQQNLLDTWNILPTRKAYTITTDTVTITGSFNVINTLGSPATLTFWTWVQNRSVAHNALQDDWGILNPVKFGTQNAALSAKVFLLEGLLADHLVVALPQNFAYRDPAFALNFPEAYNGLGLQVVPLVADNTIEDNVADVNVLPGAGGVNACDHVVTTSLINARLVTLPIDGQIINQNPPPPGGGI